MIAAHGGTVKGDMPELTTLGRRVTYLRERKGWTQKKLAEETGLSTTFISEVENDKRNVGTESLLQIAEALGASMDYLVRGQRVGQESHEPLVLPPELADAADEEGWSVGHARDLLKARGIVLARRTKEGRRRVDSMWSKQDWIDFHKKLFDVEA